MIRHENNKWVLYTHDGSKVLGKFDTAHAAAHREQQINYFKHQDKKK